MPGGKDWNRVADFVVSQRSRAKISQIELARRMRMDVKTVKRVEAGQSVSKTTLAALDDAFGLDTGTMRRTLEGVDDNELTPRTPAEKAIIESRYLSDEEKLTAVRALRVASEQQVRRLQRKQNNNPNGAADSNGSGSKSA